METVTGLESLESRRNTNILVQAAKFKKLENKPTHKGCLSPQNADQREPAFFTLHPGWKDKTLSCYSMWTRRSHHTAINQPGKEKCSHRYETVSLASIQRVHRQKQKAKQWPLTFWSKSTHKSTGWLSRRGYQNVEESSPPSTMGQPCSKPF